MPERPYGTWRSPISASMVAAGTVDVAHVAIDDGSVWWLERRPDEDGRGVVLRAPIDGGESTEVTPDDVDVRTLVHEYGGADFAVHDGVCWFSAFEDQRLYRVDTGGEPDRASDPEPVTPDPPVRHGERYADVEVRPDGERLYAVRERHYGDDAADEAVNELVTLPADGSREPRVVASGHDFYSFPRLSPDGEWLAWTTWDHPRMPWDGTELHVADVDEDGGLSDERVVLGGPDESVFQPAWHPDGDLFAVSDRTGWWNLYRIPLGRDEGVSGRPEPEAIHPVEAEFGVPQWQFGYATYTFLDDGTIAAIRTEVSRQDLFLIDPATGEAEVLDLPFEVLQARLVSDGETLATVGGGPRTPSSVVSLQPGDEPTVHRQVVVLAFEEGYLSAPEHITFPTGVQDSAEAHALYFPPTNPEFEGPGDESPPLVTMVHGGPTGQALPELRLGVQFFTSRGFGVVHVNYRGSAGYGRAYREALDGEWGVVDTEDCVNAARSLADRGLVDGDRLAITGGSAGGYAVLCALAFHDAFDAGASYYGVADLAALARETHKFESRYLDGLVGPLPEAEDRYRDRSPAFHADGIDSPLLLLQGGEDRVVPAGQAEDMVDALVDSGVPYAYVLFPEERHGFRAAASRRRALETELAFYGEAFGFEPADDLPPLELVRGEYRKQVAKD